MNNKNLKNHTLTEDEASRIGLKPGQVVQVRMYSDEEKLGKSWRKNMAKDVYFNGRRVGGTLSLEAQL